MSKSKKQKVLEHLQRKGDITSWEAWELYGSTRLSGIIFELRKDFNIETHYETRRNSEGDTITYARYKLVS